MKHMSRPKSAAVKDIDIADISGQEYRYRIDIGHGDIDPPLVDINSNNEVKAIWRNLRLLRD